MEFFDRLDSKKRREMKLNFFLPRQEIWRIDTNQRNVKNLAMEYSRIKFILKDSNLITISNVILKGWEFE